MFNFSNLKMNVIIKNYVIILGEGGFWMIKYINPHEIIKMEQFIREPADLLSKEIIENSSKKIILNSFSKLFHK